MKKIIEINHLGKSMHPFIQENDVVVLEEVSSDSVLVGDVICYYHAETNELTLHRLAEYWKAKGDWTDQIEIINPQTIIGRLISIRRSNNEYYLPQIKFLSIKNLRMRKLCLLIFATTFFWSCEKTSTRHSKSPLAIDL